MWVPPSTFLGSHEGLGSLAKFFPVAPVAVPFGWSGVFVETLGCTGKHTVGAAPGTARLRFVGKERKGGRVEHRRSKFR